MFHSGEILKLEFECYSCKKCIYIQYISIQNLLALFFAFLRKTLYCTFPCSAFLASSFKFQSYLYKTKTYKKFQLDDNIYGSPKADRYKCLPYVSAPPLFSCKSGK